MWRTIGMTLLLLAGCVVLPIIFVLVLLLVRPRNVEPWRPMPPPRR